MGTDLKLLTSRFLEHRHSLSAYIRGMVRDATVAEDVFQEVWIRLADAAEKDVEIEKLEQWCRGVARNLILRHWRDQRTSKVVADSELLDLAEQAFRESEARQDGFLARREALADCIEKLPEKSRELLRQKYEEGLKFKSIAEIQEKTAESLMMAVSRIRDRLRECVEQALRMEGASE